MRTGKNINAARVKCVIIRKRLPQNITDVKHVLNKVIPKKFIKYLVHKDSKVLGTVGSAGSDCYCTRH